MRYDSEAVAEWSEHLRPEEILPKSIAEGHASRLKFRRVIV